jgi:DNA phosphorothioation-associated putative methyltransferase
VVTRAEAVNRSYELIDDELCPLGNREDGFGDSEPTAVSGADVRRHLTALQRTAISAPVQLLLRSGLLVPGISLFDYGCGRGGDVDALLQEGYVADGWDPYYAPENPLHSADVVNLGFVINVIEDPAERADAVVSAAKLARRVLAVSVMLQGSHATGTPYSDGVITGRSTFQKYFSQNELHEYLAHALDAPIAMAGPGVALVFFDSDWEQRFLAGRYRRSDLASRLIRAAAVHRRHHSGHRSESSPPSRVLHDQQLEERVRPLLDSLWKTTLDLGRWPVASEVSNIQELEGAVGSLRRGVTVLSRHYDQDLLLVACKARKDDVLLLLAMQQFSKREPYKRLEERLQRDIRSFFGHYGAAHAAAAQLLLETASTERILEACRHASAAGLGYLEGEHSLQIHISLVERLPVVLRAYVGCAMLLWEETSEIQLIKIHIGSKKLTLLELERFEDDYAPRLRRRIKVNLRKLDYQVFEYRDAGFPQPVLYWKSRYLNEDWPKYEEQLTFDEALERTGVFLGAGEYGPSEMELVGQLEARRLAITGDGLVRSSAIPDLDQRCGANFTYRDFIECGETQRRTGMRNIPFSPETYNAMSDLATQVLDPVIEYFGGIRLTYGFSSWSLSKVIKGRIAPELDQHAGCESGPRGNPVCGRLGFACDFIVEDEDMGEVAEWILDHVPFDRMYFYGSARSIHVSYGPESSRAAYRMTPTKSGALVPRPFVSGGLSPNQ